MYVKRILLENVGPIPKLDYEFPFDSEGNPKPLVLVGANGSGKSIFLSYIVNSLVNAQQHLYENAEVKKGKVYKFQSPKYISSGQAYYYAKVTFEEEIECIEWQLNMPREDFEKKHDFSSRKGELSQIPPTKSQMIHMPQIEKTEALFNKNCILYFPPNRFEDPAWLNYENLITRAEFSDLQRISGISNRPIIQYSPLDENRNWLLDVVLDSYIYEMRVAPIQVQFSAGLPAQHMNAYLGNAGIASGFHAAANEVIRLIMRGGPSLRLGFGPRQNRDLSVMDGSQPLVANVFQLSTGETGLLNLFLSILRDYDLSGAAFEGFDKVRGIVLIDEIDVHLHCELQSKVLPSLIKRFPRVQFIVTSHSPLFLLGLKRELSADGYSILSLPEGKEISVERFAEFGHAYDVLKESARHADELANAIERGRLPVVVVEGDYDIKYLRRAAAFFDKEEFLKTLDLLDGGGFGGLHKIWKQFDCKISSVLPRKVILLYDCDVGQASADRDRVTKRVMPAVSSNPIGKGIENLFSRASIDRARAANVRFIDVTPEVKRIVRGAEETVPEKFEANLDEKKNLCNWFCENGTADDFAGFGMVFDLIEDTLKA